MVLRYLEAVLDWCKIKIPLAEKIPNVLFKEGEIWWCSIGMNVGEEEFGKGRLFMRPILIFKKFTENSFLGLPLVGHEKMGDWYVAVKMPRGISSILLNQARTFDKRRLHNRLITMRDADFATVQERFHKVYCPEINHPALPESGDRWEIPNVVSV
jgi:mRNA-degrading endonuclease toxin of MazEF toxin-antitoxin module